MELVSVVIPTYNRENVIERSIRSVLEQEYENLEILVVDDASEDNTKQVVEGIGDTRIKYRRSSRNRGAAFSRNVGIRMAKGKYIAFQDSDDEWMSGKLKKQIQIMENSNYGMVYSMYVRDFGDGKEVAVPDREIPLQYKQGNIYPYLLEKSFIGTPTMLFRREVLQEAGGFEESLKNYEDYELALRIAKDYEIGYVDEVLTKAYTLGGSIDFNPLYALGSSCYILKRYENDLKQYGLYEDKKNALLCYGRECGIEEKCKKIFKEYNI